LIERSKNSNFNQFFSASASGNVTYLATMSLTVSYSSLLDIVCFSALSSGASSTSFSEDRSEADDALLDGTKRLAGRFSSPFFDRLGVFKGNEAAMHARQVVEEVDAARRESERESGAMMAAVRPVGDILI
jgi:hypothetical protein